LLLSTAVDGSGTIASFPAQLTEPVSDAPPLSRLPVVGPQVIPFGRDFTRLIDTTRVVHRLLARITIWPCRHPLASRSAGGTIITGMWINLIAGISVDAIVVAGSCSRLVDCHGNLGALGLSQRRHRQGTAWRGRTTFNDQPFVGDTVLRPSSLTVHSFQYRLRQLARLQRQLEHLSATLIFRAVELFDQLLQAGRLALDLILQFAATSLAGDKLPGLSSSDLTPTGS
jgi:hypothetical protein